MTIFAAGILFRRKGKILLCRRSDTGDWAVPGGKVEPGETPEAAARREVMEECGINCTQPLTPYGLNSCDQGDFLTLLAEVEEEIGASLNDENTESGWFPLTELPSPLHPGLQEILEQPALTETDVAAMVARNELESPQFFYNMFLWAIRVTGTGVTWRSADKSFTFRDPEMYLTENFLERVPGTPVIWLHPEKRKLDSEEFGKRVIGTLTKAWVNDSEVWSIARVYDIEAAHQMMSVQLSTSPTVCLDEGRSDMIVVDGELLLLEDSPVLLDHVAICEKGVWDKQVAPTGIKSDSLTEVTEMTPEEIQAKIDEGIAKGLAAAKEKADAEEEDRKAKEKADAEEEDRKAKEKADAETALKARENEARGEDHRLEEERKAREKADAELSSMRKELDEVRARVPQELSDTDRDELASCQTKADSVFAGFGKRAPMAMAGEKPRQYRARILNQLKSHSPDFKTVDISTLADSAILDLAERTIFADAEIASRSPDSVGPGQLREVTRRDAAGRNISTFAGDTSAAWADFTLPARRLSGVQNAK